MKTVKDITLADTLPYSIAKDEKVAAAAKAIDPHLRDVGINANKPHIYANIDNISGKILDHIATQYNAKPWRDSWNDALKKSVIKQTIATKRKKGTLYAVKRAVESLGSSVKIVPWYEKTPQGTPGTFTIYVTATEITGEMQDDTRTMIDEAKPLSRHYEMILQLKLQSGIGVFCNIRAVTYSRIY